MKPSHLTTPRTLNECTFTPGYTTGTPRSEFSAICESLVTLVGAICIVGVLTLVVLGII